MSVPAWVSDVAEYHARHADAERAATCMLRGVHRAHAVTFQGASPRTPYQEAENFLDFAETELEAPWMERMGSILMAEANLRELTAACAGSRPVPPHDPFINASDRAYIADAKKRADMVLADLGVHRTKSGNVCVKGYIFKACRANEGDELPAKRSRH